MSSPTQNSALETTLPKVSVVIASFNTRDITASCIESLFKFTTDVALEIIVVDNASGDGSADFIVSRFPAVKLIQNERNVGFAAAQNQGVLVSSGEYILVLNSDILLVEPSVDKLVATLDQAGPEVAVIGPRIVNGDGSLAPSARRNHLSSPFLALSVINRYLRVGRWIPETLLRRALSSALSGLHDNFSSHDEIRFVEYVDGMCCLFRRSALENVGLFDQAFFFDYEIIDLSNRIRNSGWQILYHPSTTVVHLKHSSRSKIRSILIETTRSEFRYYAIHFPQQLTFLRLITTLVVGLRIAANRAAQLLMHTDRRETEHTLLKGIATVARSFRLSTIPGARDIPRLNVKSGSSPLPNQFNVVQGDPS